MTRKGNAKFAHSFSGMMHKGSFKINSQMSHLPEGGGEGDLEIEI